MAITDMNIFQFITRNMNGWEAAFFWIFVFITVAAAIILLIVTIAETRDKAFAADLRARAAEHHAAELAEQVTADKKKIEARDDVIHVLVKEIEVLKKQA